MKLHALFKNVRALLLVVLALSFFSQASANSDKRRWTEVNGNTFTAILGTYDPDSKIATFFTEDGAQFSKTVDQLSLVDQAWLKQWAHTTLRLEEELKKIGGTVDHHVTTGKYPTDLYIYNPPGVADESTRPLLILFQPSAKSYPYLLKFVESAAQLKLTVVSCGQFRNSRDKAVNDAFRERFEEVLPQIETLIPHDPKRLMMGGTSGGAMRAFGYSVDFKRPWYGIYSSVGWMGGTKYHNRPYPSGMRVAMVAGNQDPNGNRWLERDSKVLIEKGNEVGVYAFEGGHHDPPTELLTEVLTWLLRQENQDTSE